MPTKKIPPRMSLAELETRPEWQVLTAKQILFLKSYIQSGLDTGNYDAVFAVKSAYDAAKNAEILSYELLANPKIRRVVDIHFGRTEMDSVRADLLRAIKKSLRKTGLSDATVTAIKFYENHGGQKIEIPKSLKKKGASK